MDMPPHARAGHGIGRGHRFAAYPRCSAELRWGVTGELPGRLQSCCRRADAVADRSATASVLVAAAGFRRSPPSKSRSSQSARLPSSSGRTPGTGRHAGCVEPRLHGRVMAIYMLLTLGSTVIGGPFVGWICQHWNPKARASRSPASRHSPQPSRCRCRRAGRQAHASVGARAGPPPRRAEDGRAPLTPHHYPGGDDGAGAAPVEHGVHVGDHTGECTTSPESRRASSTSSASSSSRTRSTPATLAAARRRARAGRRRGEGVPRRAPDGRFSVAGLDTQTVAPHAVRARDFARAVLREPVLAGICARDLVGPDVRLYWDQSVYKQPDGAEPVLWHQDNGYTYVEPQAYLTCWIAITDATPENGCVSVMPGVHRDGTLAHRTRRSATSAGATGRPRSRCRCARAASSCSRR